MLAILRLAASLPLGLLHALGGVLGRLAAGISPAYRSKLRANLVQAGYGESLATPAAAAAGRMVGELPWVWFRPQAELLGRIVCDDLSVLEAAERECRGIVFLTPHLGAWEVTARWYACRAPITVLFKPPRKAILAPVLAAARNQPGIRSVPTTVGGVRSLIRALRRGEAIGLLPDQVPTDGDGRWVDFFGRPAYTMTLPQRLVEMTGATPVLAFGERLPGAAGWRIHLRRIEAAPTPEALNAAMELLIRERPEQYLWGYNRYKRPPGVSDGRST